MKPADAITKATLAAGQFKVIDLYTITLAGGSPTYYFTSHQVPVKNGNVTYQTGLVIKRGDVNQSIGLTVDSMDLTISPQANGSAGAPTIAGFPFLTAVQMRLLYGARVLWSRLFLDDWKDTSRGKVDFFQGRVNEISMGRLTVQLTVNSDIEMLNMQMPRNLIMKTCVHDVYDVGCGLRRSSFTDNATVASGSTVLKIFTNLTRPDDWFTLGRLNFLTGALAGIPISYFVKHYQHTSGAIEFFRPLPILPAIGDTIAVSAGCNNLLATCSNNDPAVGPQFNNRARFKGCPYVPVPETLYDGGTSQPAPPPTLANQGGAGVGSSFSSAVGTRGLYKP